ncbi:hypothetical protein HDU78_008573 [Chytriomyces hyalinus]|uniref:Uncharacterized protein n=1 Tax=Chytriomyces confervae TaxID=246404 RepID=A0A507FCV6_9FUNG|nr:hypothetical protein HDU78_008573 [Chytriomyces hyalinus]KAJ3407781.1 hypothetical protein HDU80_007726 [Chytriomyces hyalinus]TPX74179.1 hypothetical protein CcCBS67573_g04552 [Chytriomyces confervae]
MIPASAASLTAATTSPTKNLNASNGNSPSSSAYLSAVSTPTGRNARSRKPTASLNKTAQPLSPDAEREQLITQAIDLQETVRGLIDRIENARGDHTKIASENSVLLKYINNLMSA